MPSAMECRILSRGLVVLKFGDPFMDLSSLSGRLSIIRPRVDLSQHLELERSNWNFDDTIRFNFESYVQSCLNFKRFRGKFSVFE